MELLRIQRRLRTSGQRAWALISDFGGLAKWNPAVIDCTLDGAGLGAVRTIRYPADLVVREQLIELDYRQRYLRYLFLSGRDMPLRGFSGTISIISSSDEACQVEWRYDAECVGRRELVLDFTADLASRAVRRLSDLEAAATQA